MQACVCSHFGDNFFGCHHAGDDNALGGRRVDNILNLCAEIGSSRNVDCELSLCGGHTIINCQIEIVFLNGDFARRHKFVFGDFGSGHNSVSQIDAIVQNIVVHLVVANAGTEKRAHSLRLVHFHLDKAFFNVVSVNRHAERGLRLSVKTVELCHFRNLILCCNSLPLRNDVVCFLIAEKPINRVVRAGYVKSDIQPFILRNHAKNAVFISDFTHYLLSPFVRVL